MESARKVYGHVFRKGGARPVFYRSSGEIGATG